MKEFFDLQQQLWLIKALIHYLADDVEHMGPGERSERIAAVMYELDELLPKAVELTYDVESKLRQHAD